MQGTAVGLVAASLRTEASYDHSGGQNVGDVLKISDLDRRIWQEELEEFVPKRLWDMHVHLTQARFDLDAPIPASPLDRLVKNATIEVYRACESLLYTGRHVLPFVLPAPHPHCDIQGSNPWAAGEVKKQPGAACTMIVHPKMTAEEVDRNIRQYRFVGFKPFMWYANVKNYWECRIPDYLPEHLIEVANQYGLIMAVHLSKRAAIGDSDNLDDLERLAAKYQKVRWLLLHNARSYSALPIEKAAARLRNIPNIWFESSSVCEADAFYATLANLDVSRFCYGSDDPGAGIVRGKYIAWGYAWSQIDEHNQKLSVVHCDGRMTFVRYEMLRAMKRAAKYAGLNRQQIEDIFYNNADRLVNAVRNDLEHALGPRT